MTELEKREIKSYYKMDPELAEAQMKDLWRKLVRAMYGADSKKAGLSMKETLDNFNESFYESYPNPFTDN